MLTKALFSKPANPALDAALDAALKRAAKLPPMNREEMEAQRRSFVRGEAGIGSDADEAAMSAAIASGDRVEIDRLNAESEARVRAADAYLERGF